MKPYNAAFFGLFQNVYLVSREQLGEKQALLLFTATMEKGLKAAYGTNFVKGDPKSFVTVVGERDKDVGLDVKFKDVSDSSLTYEFYTDPFPALKNELPHATLDAAYMNFKVRHLLGHNWKYQTTKHLWNGDDCTRHVISKTKLKLF
jgi:hypothetical protein